MNVRTDPNYRKASLLKIDPHNFLPWDVNSWDKFEPITWQSSHDRESPFKQQKPPSSGINKYTCINLVLSYLFKDNYNEPFSVFFIKRIVSEP